MTVRKVLQYPAQAERLRQKSSAVKRLDDKTRQLITDLKDTLATQPGAGLAAPQIGVFKQVALVCFGQDEQDVQPPITLINPEILEVGPDIKSFDGCLSMPGLVTWDALRPSWLVFRARDEQWKPFTMRVEGIDAAVVHHEVDHLNGILFLDRLSAESKLFHVRKDEQGNDYMVELKSAF